VDGGIVFRSGSTRLVETNPADLSSDLIHVTGSAQLEGGTVRHVGLDAPYPLDSSCLILTADDGVSGTFDEVVSDLLFLTPSLLYVANNVWLQLSRNSRELTSFARTPTQQAVAEVIEDAGEDTALLAPL